MRWLLAALVILAQMPSLPVAAKVCWLQSRDQFVANLLGNLHQFRVFTGREYTNEGAQTSWTIEVHAEPGGGGWTVFAWAKDTGQICLLSRGRRWSFNKET